MASRFILAVMTRARSGDAESLYLLGRVYLEGGEGLAANTRTADLWLCRAAAARHQAA